MVPSGSRPSSRESAMPTGAAESGALLPPSATGLPLSRPQSAEEPAQGAFVSLTPAAAAEVFPAPEAAHMAAADAAAARAKKEIEDDSPGEYSPGGVSDDEEEAVMMMSQQLLWNHHCAYELLLLLLGYLC